MPTVRVGVTGHRTYADHDLVVRQIDAVLDRLCAGGERSITAISSLAEGADRVVAELVLRREGGRIEVVLPVGEAEYASDFADQRSLHEFGALLERADSIVVVPSVAGGTREEAYERAGRAVVERCDTLIAVWDGDAARGRGGTGEIVGYAIARSVPVELVLVRR